MADSAPSEPPAPSISAIPTAENPVPYNPEWYTWRQFFRILVGRASTTETKQYVHMNSLAHEESDCARCEQWRDWLFTYSPVVRFMRDNIEKLGGDMEPARVVCRRCDTLAAGGPQAGGWNRWHLMLCANHVSSRSKLEDVLTHEMVHEYDRLRFKFDELNLKHQACSEIRANLLSGECRFIRQFGHGGQWKFTGLFQDCVRRRAALSVAMLPACKDDVQAVKVVNEVWEGCFADTRPFDEIYR